MQIQRRKDMIGWLGLGLGCCWSLWLLYDHSRAELVSEYLEQLAPKYHLLITAEK
jgi:hypothetical protein